MDNDKNKRHHVLHVFDPMKKHKPHDEVYFSYGRYLDIATSKGKDPNTLYFGSSNTSKLLSGIFLGDIELTSKVKDVSIISNNGDVILSVKYINNLGKLATVKTKIPSEQLLNDVKDLLKTFDVNAINTSFNDIYGRLNIIDGSIVDIYNCIDTLNTSINDLDERFNIIDGSIVDIYNCIDTLNTSINDLDERYDELLNIIDNIDTTVGNKYTIHKSIGSADEGFAEKYTLYSGSEIVENSSVIEHISLTLRNLDYDIDSNSIQALLLPSAIKSINLDDNTATLIDGTTVDNITDKLDDKFMQSLSIDMSDYDEHINILTNIDSSINDRLTIVEDTLKWENLK